MTRPACDLTLYFVVGEAEVPPGRLEEVVRAAVGGGVTLVQLREKQADDRRFLDLARALVALLAPSGVPLILNDRVHLVADAGAAGAHIGQEDGDPAAARAILGPDRILGVSAHAPEQARAVAGIADHLGVGPFAATTTKADARAPIGAQGVAAVRAASPLPIVAIGGLTAANAPAAIAAGADGVAVVSAIARAADPAAAARDLRKAVARGRSPG